MKRICCLFLMMIMLLPSFLMAGCGQEKGLLTGKWGYIHDPETVILELKDNGKAVFHDVKYSYTTDDSYIHLSNKDGNLDIRYTYDGKDFTIYELSTYEYKDEGTPDGIIGNWYNAEKKWSFEFTSSGTFKEDGYFPGYYTLGEDGTSISLVYNDHFLDSTLYYSIDGNQLTLEYPWPMVEAQ